jgi:hypothetical protein
MEVGLWAEARVPREANLLTRLDEIADCDDSTAGGNVDILYQDAD